jgi:signal transduction histidine kinase
MLQQLNRFIDFWVPAHLKGDGDPYLRGRLMVQSFLIVVPLMLFYGVLYPLLGHFWGGAISLIGTINASWGIVDFRKRGNLSFSGNLFALTSYVIVIGLSLTTGGINFIAPWVLLAPVSAFLLVSNRSGMFWSALAFLFVLGLFGMRWLDVSIPNFVNPEYASLVDFFSLYGLISYLVVMLLNNDLGKMRMLNELRAVQRSIVEKNQEITVINQDLESTVARRTEGLQAANEELDTFLYESSHALRRPLMRILGLMSLLENEHNAAEKEEYMRLMGYTAHNMDKMLQDLLLVSEVYKKELAPRALHLAAEIEKLADAHRNSDVLFEIGIPTNLRILVDAELCHIVLKKLVDNAVFYRRDAVAHRVQITATVADSLCTLHITDNGIGIDPTVIPQLFKMFARGTERSRGSGLGLFIVSKAMERLDGNVWVESVKGQHTTIFLTFKIG